MIDEKEFEEMIIDGKKALLASIKNIREGNFDIRPTKFEKEQNSPCSYCKLNAVCFHEAKDMNIISIDSEEEIKESE